MNEALITPRPEESGCTPITTVLGDCVLAWTRQADGSYARAGGLPEGASTARIFVVAEDHVESPGTKLRPKEEAVALVERKIAEGSYKAWRYEVRPETSTAVDPSDHELVLLPHRDSRTCANPRCKKGRDDTRGEVKSRRAKYCCNTCRVDVCRRNRKKANPEQVDKPRRKPRSDRKYESHAARQRAYEYRRCDPDRLSCVSVQELASKA